MSDLERETVEYLRLAGQDAMADHLESQIAPDPEPTTPALDEGEQFVADLKAALRGNRTSLPSLLDE
jgi:hypothetical protein